MHISQISVAKNIAFIVKPDNFSEKSGEIHQVFSAGKQANFSYGLTRSDV